MRDVELLARKIIGRVFKCAVVLAFIVWCISYELPKRIESYGPKHVQTKQTDSSESDADSFLLDYMYYHYLPQTTILF
ncbi:hypothetical protein ABD71_04715 [Brevibacillus laterosporus]|nr:hypothetical protein [Brevibacillus laterosporus]